MPGYGLGNMPPIPSLGTASQTLGLGGMLQDQVAGETEEQRKRRMQLQQAQQSLGASGAMPGTPSGQMASLSLFGGNSGFGTTR